MSKPLLITALLALPVQAAAQAAATAPQETSFIGELVSIMVPLAFIILVLFAVLHFARRRYGLTAHDAPLSVVQVLPLGPRERIVLVKSRGGRVLAVGVGGQSVNLIAELEASELVSTGIPDAAGSPQRPNNIFGALLKRRDPTARNIATGSASE